MLRRNALVADSGYRNILRKVPSGSVLYMPALPEGFERGVIKDYSGNSNHGTITGAPWTRLPSGLRILSFAGGTNVVTVPAAASLSTEVFTLEFWIKTTATSKGIFSGYNDVYNGGLSLSVNGTGKLAVDSPFVANICASTTSINTGLWVHSAVTRTADGAYLVYTNGASDGSGTQATDPLWNNWVIGKSDLAGIVADIGVFKGLNRVLTALEITSDYQRERHLFVV